MTPIVILGIRNVVFSLNLEDFLFCNNGNTGNADFETFNIIKLNIEFMEEGPHYMMLDGSN